MVFIRQSALPFVTKKPYKNPVVLLHYTCQELLNVTAPLTEVVKSLISAPEKLKQKWQSPPPQRMCFSYCNIENAHKQENNSERISTIVVLKVDFRRYFPY